MLQLLFGLGAILTLWAFYNLGTSFSILPAMRQICSTGPYRLVRHPAYLGELLMLLCFVLARPSWFQCFQYLLIIPMIVIRIQAEEALLSNHAQHSELQNNVRYRLVPGIW